MSNLLVFGDAHIPAHSPEAFKLLLKVGHYFRPNYLISLGDLWDAYSCSTYSKNPLRAGQLDSELKIVNACMDQLDALNARDKTFVGGNHEERLQRYLQDKAPALFETVRLEKLLKLQERGWRYIPYRQSFKLGKVIFTHDLGSGGKYANFQNVTASGGNIVTGHTHLMGAVVEGNTKGEIHLSASYGWLGDPAQADYASDIKKRNWVHGCGIGHYVNGIVYLTQVPFIRGTANVDGKIISL